MGIFDLSPTAIIGDIKRELSGNFEVLLGRLDEVISLLKEHNDLHEQDGR